MDGYSRMVQFFKVLLPLAAIALLSTVFLLSRSIERNVSGPFSQNDMDARLAGQQVTQPLYSGTTRKGEEIQVSATKAHPGGDDIPATAAAMNGVLRLLGGGVIYMESDDGAIRPDKATATFTGNVVLTTADGIRVTTDELSTALNEIRGETPGRVNGVGPIGNLTAGRMTFGTEKEDGPVHILFTDGVKLIYVPEKSER